MFRHPAQVVAFAFATAAAIGTVLLMLPMCRTDGDGAPLVTALFTATSAVCVTGLTVVDTATYWSVTGQVVILGLIQVGGFGIMTLGSLIALFLARRMGLRTRLTAAAETRSVGLGDVRRVLRGVFIITFTVESVVALLLTLRFRSAYDGAWGTAVWHGVFHAVSSFNNAGFALYSDNLMRFLTDGFVLMPISVAIVIGGIGFPVLIELLRNRRPRTWSLHTRLTLLMTGALLVIGTVFMSLTEWDNEGTLGPLSLPAKLLGAWFHAVQPRTAGFNAWDYGAVTDETLLGTIMLMFVGGGSAGTAGGLKVTTFIVLFFVIVAEVRGEEDVIAFDRRIEHRVVRQATTVALLGVAAVLTATMLLTELTELPFRDVLFESTSAFATVGLSTGITPKVGDGGELVLVVLMFLGRLGPITLVSALTLRERNRRYRYPEGAPLIG
ncbi:ATPase [Knoellia sp. Soil729]|nr:ATPase [Knoellia sp. Soil729]